MGPCEPEKCPSAPDGPGAEWKPDLRCRKVYSARLPYTRLVRILLKMALAFMDEPFLAFRAWVACRTSSRNAAHVLKPQWDSSRETAAGQRFVGAENRFNPTTSQQRNLPALDEPGEWEDAYATAIGKKSRTKWWRKTT